MSCGEMGSRWSARSRIVRVVFGGSVEVRVECTHVDIEGPLLGKRVEQTMRAIFIMGSAILVVMAVTVVQLEAVMNVI